MRSIILLCLCLPALLPAAEATKRYITLDGTRLLSKPAAFSKSLGTLKKGDIVMAQKAKNGYSKVKVISGNLNSISGYLSNRAVQASKPRIGVLASKGRDASAEEVAAATKGFNKQVEAEHKKKNAKLDYDLVTTLEERTAFENPKDTLEGFRESGKLGEFSEANNE